MDSFSDAQYEATTNELASREDIPSEKVQGSDSASFNLYQFHLLCSFNYEQTSLRDLAK